MEAAAGALWRAAFSGEFGMIGGLGGDFCEESSSWRGIKPGDESSAGCRVRKYPICPHHTMLLTLSLHFWLN